MTLLYRILIYFLFFSYQSLSFADTKNHTSLPLEFNTGNPKPYGLPSTTISIQGKSIPLIFDTGAKKSEITLSEHALEGLNVKFTGNQVCFDSLDGKHCEKEFIVPEVKIGTFVLKNVNGTLMPKLWGGNDQGFTPTEASKNGVIGYTLLSQFNVLLDYPSNKFILYQKGIKLRQYDLVSWISLPFKEHLHTEAIINGRKIVLSWDTGSVPSIIKQDLAKDLNPVDCEKNTPYGKDNNCRRIITKAFHTVEGSKFPSTWFLIRNIPPTAPFDALIGSNFFMDNLVFFDFEHHKIYIKNINHNFTYRKGVTQNS